MKSFTIWAEMPEQLDDAVEKIDEFMETQGPGQNAIHYQIIGNDQPMPWNTGFIKDEALSEMQQGFIVCADATEA